jgi:hypothetical protein
MHTAVAIKREENIISLSPKGDFGWLVNSAANLLTGQLL